ncbi:Ocrl [Symbiodinium sp. KB8]|nr:Ocrl [Symbiodinium sp. KB8]
MCLLHNSVQLLLHDCRVPELCDWFQVVLPAGVAHAGLKPQHQDADFHVSKPDISMNVAVRCNLLAFSFAFALAAAATPLHVGTLTLALYVASILAYAGASCKSASRKASAWRSGLETSDSVEVAEVAIASGAQWILICGGEPCRDIVGARLGARLELQPNALAFFSSGHFKLQSDFAPEAAVHQKPISHFPGVDLLQLQKVMQLDREAIDTLANFTTFLRCIDKKRLARNRSAPVDVVVVTSSYHVPRAKTIATLVLGSRGLSFHFAEAPAQGVEEKEDMARRSLREGSFRCARDALRALVWLVSSFEGATLVHVFAGDCLAGLLHQNRPMEFFCGLFDAPPEPLHFVQPSEELLGYAEASTVVDVLDNDVITRTALHALLVRNRLRPTEAAVFILGHGDCCGTRRELLLAVPLCTNLVVELCRVPPSTQARPDGQVFLVLDGLVEGFGSQKRVEKTGKGIRLTPEEFAGCLEELHSTAHSHRYFFPSKETNHDWIYSYGVDRLPLAVQKASQPMWQRKKPDKMTSLIFQDTHISMLVEPHISWKKIQPFLQERQTEFSEEARRSIMTVTFNCASQKPMAHDIHNFFVEGEPLPDIIFVALQETCPLALAIDVTEIASAQYHKAWSSAVTAAVKHRGEYRLLADYAMVGLQLLLYVLDDLAPKVSQTCWGSARCGTLGAGNKGAVAFGLVMGSTSFCFVNSHLAAGESTSSSQERSQDFDYIIQTLRLTGISANCTVGPVDVRDSRNIFEHDLVVWAGDLNMRLWRDVEMTEVMHQTEVLSLLQQHQLQRLLDCDELHRRRLASGSFAAFEEAAIDFRPSYKFRPMSKSNKDEAMQDVKLLEALRGQYDDKRTPAWCDRVIWRARRKVKQEGLLRYELLDSTTFSDHRPVRLCMQICIHEMSLEDLRRVCSEYELKRSASLRLLRSGSSFEEAAEETEVSLTKAAL